MNLEKFFRFTFWVSLVGLLVFILDFGYDQSITNQHYLNFFYLLVLLFGVISTTLRYFNDFEKIKRKVIVFDFISILFTISVILIHFLTHSSLKDESWLYDDIWVKIAIFLTFLREFSELKLNYNTSYLNPAQLFIFSFLIIIILGALMLMLPNASHGKIDFINALFTSTSAVCVTGLAVEDTATFFTPFGQTIILVLIQIGGLGILTFASYFTYFFKGGDSYKNQLTLSEITSTQKIGQVFKTLKYIVSITFIVESISAISIFLSLDKHLFNSLSEKIFFSVFHAISAFCNAGFSTLSSSMYEEGFRYDYNLQFIIILTFVFGGLGFPIMVNVLSYIRHVFKRFLLKSQQRNLYRPWVLNINSRITLVTTMSLNVVAFFLFFIFEGNNTLAAHHGLGKVVAALFEATTPRTAGFNNVDMAALSFPAVMITIFLMWIGASPASTGGGIKTSTLAIATMNIISLARGKERIEVFRKEIADISVRRAFATISLSLIVIGLGTCLIAIFDGHHGLLNIVFECFSAYSTVGLSLGITASLGTGSKIVIMFIMFIGRVTMLSILIAVLSREKYTNYRYPREEITIN
ncbi:MAG TPA: potassium transporter TrkG [Saprospiraceae bacterium]|nr:potassium transporter TrkG [Saprospiraceae bacterium]